MTTKIELQAMDAVIGIHREMRKAGEPNWEQRRYEIAKEIFTNVWADNLLTDENIAKMVVTAADALIAELQKTK